MSTFIPVYKDTYYEYSGSTLEFYIIADNETIYNGKAWKGPTGNIRVKINDIAKDYLENTINERYPFSPSIDSGITYKHNEAFKYFYLYRGDGTLLETYGILFDWGKEFVGDPLILSEPIRPRITPAQKIPFSIYTPYTLTLSLYGDFSFRIITDTLNFSASGGTKHISWQTTLPGSEISVTTNDAAFTVSNITQGGCDITVVPNMTFNSKSATATIYCEGESVGTVSLVQEEIMFTLNTTGVTFRGGGETKNVYWTTNMASASTYITVVTTNTAFTASNITQTGCQMTAASAETIYETNASANVYFSGSTLLGTISLTRRGLHFYFAQDFVPFPKQGGTMPVDWDTDIDVSVLTFSISNTAFTYSNVTQTGCKVTAPSTVDTSVTTTMSVYLGGTLLDTTTLGYNEYIGKYLTFEVLSDGTVSLPNTYSYRKNGGNWTSGVTSIEASNGDIIEFKCVKSAPYVLIDGAFTGTSVYYNVYGNYKSCIFGDDFINNLTSSNSARRAFRGTNVVNAKNLILMERYILQECYQAMFSGCAYLVSAPTLPATKLAKRCYMNMFSDCTSLTTAPSIPATGAPEQCCFEMFKGCTALTTASVLSATTLSGHCYYGMFQNCSSLVNPPVLPATSLSGHCYEQMFRGCTSLASAPALPATTLAAFCYEAMFYHCAALTTAPVLPATVMATGCYDMMFEACDSLVNPPVISSTSLADDCYREMFAYCTSLVTPPALPATTMAFQCYFGMFADCTKLTSAPTLPASVMEEGCYQYMFEGCTKLNATPALPATTLAESCYEGMFSGCTSLTSASALAADTMATKCYSRMFEGCTSLVTAPVMSATTMAEECCSFMFSHCTSLVNAPVLPATTMANDCYREMFNACASLVTAPALPATVLADGCYLDMFNGCTSLTNVPNTLPASVLAIGCYNRMFTHCTSLTTAPALPASALTQACYMNMFTNCTSLTTAPVLTATTLVTDCYKEMFEGCTSLSTVVCLNTDTPSANYSKDWLKNVAANGTLYQDPNNGKWRNSVGYNYGPPMSWTVQEYTP